MRVSALGVLLNDGSTLWDIPRAVLSGSLILLAEAGGIPDPCGGT